MGIIVIIELIEKHDNENDDCDENGGYDEDKR